MIEAYLMGQPGLDWIAAALFAVGLTLLIGDAVIPGLGPGGVIGLICQIACFAPDLVGGSSAWSVLALAALGSAGQRTAARGRPICGRRPDRRLGRGVAAGCAVADGAEYHCFFADALRIRGDDGDRDTASAGAPAGV